MRERDIEILDRALTEGFDHDPVWWEQFLQITLRLPLACYFSVVAVLREGGWRSARNPIGYVVTAARWKAKRDGWLNDATDNRQPLDDGVIVRDFVSRTDKELAQESASGAGIQFLAHDLALDRLALSDNAVGNRRRAPSLNPAPDIYLDPESPLTPSWVPQIARRQRRRGVEFSDLLFQSGVDWEAVLNETADDELRKYVRARLTGTVGSWPEAVRKRFQRSIPELRESIKRHILIALPGAA